MTAPKMAGLLVVLALLVSPGPASARPVVWLMGDSLTAVYASFVWAQNPSWTVLNLGRGSETAALALERTRQLLAAGPAPDVVVLQWGTNDTILEVPNRAFVDDFIELAELFRFAGSIAIVVRPIGFAPLASLPPDLDAGSRDLLRVYLQHTVEQRQSLATGARNRGLPYCAVRTRPKWFWADAFHPTTDAYRDLVAPALMRCIRRFAKI